MFPRTLQTAMNGDENDNQEPVEMPLIEGAPPLSHSTDIPQLSIPSSSDEASYPVYSHSPLILPSSRMTREPFDDTGLDLSLIEGTVYPFEEERHRRVGLVASVVIHLFLAAVVLLAAWFFGIRSLRQFMAGPVHQSPPPDSIQVVLLQDDEIPPPPTPHPEFIIQKLIQPPAPKPLVIKPPPPKPPPPRPVVQHKAIKAAPTPAVATNSASNSGALKVVVGSGSFPAPDYPPEADLARIQGTVMIDVTFDSGGHVSSASISQSSGSRILDDAARETITHDWFNASYANVHSLVPVTFNLKAGVH